MGKKFVNTWIGGLNRDIAKDKYPNNRYWDARNIRLLTDKGLSTGNISSETGMELSAMFPSVIPGEIAPPGNIVVVGTTTIREWVVFFTCTPSLSQIWKVRIDPTTGNPISSTVNQLNITEHLCYNQNLGFHPSHRIYARGYYETPEVAKVYFTDNYNVFRHFNIFDPDSMSIPPSRLEIVPDIIFSSIVVDDVISGGTYKSGMVQYSYMLYNLHGAQSAFSPTTSLVHITPSDDHALNTDNYLGGGQATMSNKAVNLHINNLDQRFSHFKLVSLHYDTIDATPDIKIVHECAVPSNGTVVITDTGNNLGTITMNEFTMLGNVNFKCKTFEIKDNMIFPANITEQFFDVDWDARAYRFHSSRRARLMSSDGTIFTVGPTFTDIYTGLPVPAEHDCIQRKYMQTEDDNYDPGNFGHRFMADGTTVGGEGPNLKYYFTIKPVVIDNDVDAKLLRTVPEGSSTNPSYTNNASPIVHMDVGYLRGEIYRFGIIFRNTKGQASFVKWIGDIKMPDAYETCTIGPKPTYQPFWRDNNNRTVGGILHMTFILKNVPVGAVSWEIVRSVREEWDRTIIGQGYWQPLFFWHKAENSGARDAFVLRPGLHGVDDTWWRGQDSEARGGNGVGYVITPEFSFFKRLKYEAGLRLHVIGTGSKERAIINSDQNYSAEAHEWPECYLYNVYNYNKRCLVKVPILDAVRINPSPEIRYILNQTFSIIDFCWAEGHDTAKNERSYFYGSTALAFAIEFPLIWFNSGYSDEPRLVNIVREGHIPYGGNTYIARTFTQYISCMQPVPVSQLMATVFGGDSYVEVFDYILHQHDNSAWYAISEFALLPVETSICLPLRHDRSFTKLYGQPNYNLHEIAGTHGTTPTVFTQGFDAYLYNSAYSRTNTLKTYIPKPLNFSSNRVFDARITVGMPKVINEEIDSWTRFLANTYKDVDASCGPINALVVFENKLMFLQDQGLGVIAVNDKVLTVPDETGTTMTLGRGGLLDDFTYITRRSGCMHQYAALVSGITKDALYYYDGLNNQLMVYRISGRTYAKNETAPLSIMKGIQSFLNEHYSTQLPDETLLGKGVHMGNDSKNNRLLITFLDSPTNSATVAFNEILQTFESFYDFVPQWYQRIGVNLLSQDRLQHYGVFVHNKGMVGKFYNKFYNSYVSFLVNPQPTISKIYANLEYNLRVTLNGIDQHDRNFDYMRLWNEHQDTGLKPLILGVNTRRRFRIWHVTIPRASANVLDRIRSQEVQVTLYFYNTKGEEFVLEDVSTNIVVHPL